MTRIQCLKTIILVLSLVMSFYKVSLCNTPNASYDSIKAQLLEMDDSLKVIKGKINLFSDRYNIEKETSKTLFSGMIGISTLILLIIAVIVSLMIFQLKGGYLTANAQKETMNRLKDSYKNLIEQSMYYYDQMLVTCNKFLPEDQQLNIRMLALVLNLQNPGVKERFRAVTDLGYFGDETVIPYLIPIMENDPNTDLRKDAQIAIEDIKKRINPQK